MPNQQVVQLLQMELVMLNQTGVLPQAQESQMLFHKMVLLQQLA